MDVKLDAPVLHACINGLFGQVGDFGLARRQSSGEVAEETRVLGTIGYLAPEYAETGKITDKADVYAFGVVLLELITGRKAIDYTRARNEVSLTDWVRTGMLLYHLVTTVTALRASAAVAVSTFTNPPASIQFLFCECGYVHSRTNFTLSCRTMWERSHISNHPRLF